MTMLPGETYDRDAPDKTWAVSTRSDTYFVNARTPEEAREVMGWTFDHDGIRDRRITSITLLDRRK